MIWISLLHTWRSCSLLTNIRFKAHFTPLLVLTRKTRANPPVRRTQEDEDEPCAVSQELWQLLAPLMELTLPSARLQTILVYTAFLRKLLELTARVRDALNLYLRIKEEPSKETTRIFIKPSTSFLIGEAS